MATQLEKFVLGSPQLTPISANGLIGQAASTVDIASSFVITASAAGLLATIPIPTTPINGQVVLITNLGAFPITINGSLLPVNQSVAYIFAFSVWTRIANPPTREPKITTFIASGSFTKDPATIYAIIEMVGGGGGGAPVAVSTATTIRIGGSGGAGGYVRAQLSAAIITANAIPVTIGAAGLGTIASGGTGGGNTTFGALLTANGGTQSTATSALGAVGVPAGAGNGGGFAINVPADAGSRTGDRGGIGFVIGSAAAGQSGNIPLTTSSQMFRAVTGSTGLLVGLTAAATIPASPLITPAFGCGGMGGYSSFGGAAAGGGDGGGGYCRVTEYF